MISESECQSNNMPILVACIIWFDVGQWGAFANIIIHQHSIFNYSFTSSSFCFRAELDLFHELSLSRYFGPIIPVDPVVNNKTDNVSDSCDTRRVEAQI